VNILCKVNINNIRYCNNTSPLGYVRLYTKGIRGDRRMVQSLIGLRDKVMLAHAWSIVNIDLVSILVFTAAASGPA